MKKRKDKNGILLRKGERQLDNGHYQYRYTDPFGERHAFNAETLDELRGKEREEKRESEEGRAYATGNISVIELVKRYLKLKQNSRYNTRVNYNTVTRIIEKEEFGRRKIRDIKASDAKLWVSDLQARGLSYSAIANIRGVVKPAFDLAWDEEIIRRNPFAFKLTDAIVNDTTPRVALTPKQKAIWMDFIRNDRTYSKYYDEFVVLFETGIRVSEFCGLTRKDLDFANRKIRVDHQLCRERMKGENRYFVERTKTKAGRRDIPMTDEVYQSLQNIIRSRPKLKTEMVLNGYSGFLLIDKNGNPKVALHIENEFRWAEHKYKKLHPDAPLPHITPHVARHTFSTLNSQNGLPSKALQYLMGHSDARVTMNIYTHANYEYAADELVKIQKKAE